MALNKASHEHALPGRAAASLPGAARAPADPGPSSAPAPQPVGESNPEALPFPGLSAAEEAWLRQRMAVRRYAPNQLICRQGDRADELFVLLSGVVRVYRSWPGGQDRTYAVLAAPAWFGEGGVVGEGGEQRSANVAALSWASVALLHRGTFAAFERAHPRGAVKILRTLGRGLLRRLQDTSLGSEQLVFQPARRRLAATVLNLAQGCGHLRDGSLVIPVRLSHATLGEMAGLTRETTCRVLNEWLARGWVKQERGVLSITAGQGLDALRDLAGGAV